MIIIHKKLFFAAIAGLIILAGVATISLFAQDNAIKDLEYLDRSATGQIAVLEWALDDCVKRLSKFDESTKREMDAVDKE